MRLYGPVCVGPCWKSQRQVFSCYSSNQRLHDKQTKSLVGSVWSGLRSFKIPIWAALWENHTRSHTNQTVQPHKMVRSLKFCIQGVEGLYYLCSENKGADELRGYPEADLRLCFRICKKTVFSRHGSFSVKHRLSLTAVVDLSLPLVHKWFC